jgi:lipid II:glycine glycyltransferase (peptidoglycan interpeptide bridge formation enzyme)
VIASGNGFIVEATHMGRPIASNVFFTFGKQALYKYGASDYTHQELRANNLVMWTAIQWLVCRGCDTLHLGRTSLANEGLRRFKRGWGAVEYRLPYHKYDFKLGQYTTEKDQAQGWHTNLFRHMPISLARILGFLLYRHAA